MEQEGEEMLDTYPVHMEDDGGSSMERKLEKCPSPVGTSSTELNKTHWVRQDKLILSAILASTSTTITPLIATAKTSHEAWKKLNHMYANKSRTQAMQLKEELTLIQRGTHSIPDYLHAVKALANEIALIDHPISDDDLTLYILNRLGFDFREIATPIRARETSLAFKELHDILMGHEGYLRRLEMKTQQLVASANFSYRNKMKFGASAGYQSNGPYKAVGPSRSQGQNRNSQGQRNRKSSNTPNQHRYQPKCQFCNQMGHTAKFAPNFIHLKSR
ncbi:hypothetical protein F2P56_024022 [Juglans regia]|uniref:Retrovirus-related Pol polyprotein from transposon RE1 n=1 Tax=Juglans regia TaxID=51240 RepID=A0A833ULA8_JUGRE|nr:hypothetical protein F2P56_024022 [Juglans regia]